MVIHIGSEVTQGEIWMYGKRMMKSKMAKFSMEVR